MQNRDEGLISAGNALQLESHAKINSGKTMNLRDKRKDNARASNFGKYVAGVVGFEPTVHATKKRCLTAWLHPNCGGVYDALAR
jgi:hypothetical protein